MDIKTGCPSNQELLNLAHEIGKKWRCLGRALDIPENDLEMINEDEKKLFDKSYNMLMMWKQWLGVNATYRRLDTALEHTIVKRKDLAEKFCYVYKREHLSSTDI